MFHCKSLTRLPIIDVATEEVLGTCGTIYLNRTLKAVACLGVRSAEMPHITSHVIAFSNIIAIGRNAILVRTDEQTDESLSVGIATHTIYGRRVTSQRHIPIGMVGDVILDAHGAVLGFWLERIMTQGALARHPFLKREAVSYVGSPTMTMQIDVNRSHYYAMTLGQQARRARKTVI